MLKKLLISIIRLYQKAFSDENSLYHRLGFRKKHVCTFFPSCSEYAIEAIRKYGPIKGSFMGMRRIGRCHPWQREHFDPVP